MAIKINSPKVSEAVEVFSPKDAMKAPSKPAKSLSDEVLAQCVKYVKSLPVVTSENGSEFYEIGTFPNGLSLSFRMWVNTEETVEKTDVGFRFRVSGADVSQEELIGCVAFPNQITSKVGKSHLSISGFALLQYPVYDTPNVCAIWSSSGFGQKLYAAAVQTFVGLSDVVPYEVFDSLTLFSLYSLSNQYPKPPAVNPARLMFGSFAAKKKGQPLILDISYPKT